MATSILLMLKTYTRCGQSQVRHIQDGEAYIEEAKNWGLGHLQRSKGHRVLGVCFWRHSNTAVTALPWQHIIMVTVTPSSYFPDEKNTLPPCQWLTGCAIAQKH